MKLPISGGELSPQNMVRVKGRGVQKTHRPAKPDPTQPAGLGYKNFFYSGSSWVWVIKLQTRQTRPNPPYLIYI